jgi:ABC-2 type transport system permease protein
MSFGYLAVEVRGVLRSTRFLIFSVAFPVLLFLLYVGIFANGDRAVVGVLIVNMTAFGALSAAIGKTGARTRAEAAKVAEDRGWL